MFDPRAEAMSADERGALQEQRLQALVDRLLELGGLQGQRLRASGVTAGRDVALADLHRLPTTAKTDLWDAYPFGLLAVPREQVVAVHGSSGTGGRPTLVGYTRADLDLWADMVARSLACAGAGPGTIVHNAYGYGLFTGGVGFHLGGGLGHADSFASREVVTAGCRRPGGAGAARRGPARRRGPR
jgi:phenylacetate-CoA ligase